MRNKSNRNLGIAGVSVVIVIVLLVSALQLTGVISLFAVSDYHTGINPSTINNMETEHFTENVWKGQDKPGGGYPFKEMLPDEKYITSFSGASGDDALSERISIVGNIYENSWVELSHPTGRVYYQAFIKTDPSQVDWTPIIGLNYYDPLKVTVIGGTGYKQVDPDSGWGGAEASRTADPIEIRLIGSTVGALKVQAVWEFWDVNPFNPNWWRVMSIDYAYLISGQGQINIEGYSPTDVPMYEIGDTVPIYVAADYSGATASGTGRWQLWAFPLRGGPGRLLKEWTYDYFRETFGWVLPDDAWIRGSSDSKWRLELKNTLFSTDAVMVNTIDVMANAPPTPTISTSPDIPQLGEIITVTLSANTNILTHEKIVKFIVRGVYPDTNYQFVYKDVVVDAGSADPYTATTTIAPPRAGIMQLQAWAHDEAGRQSEVPGNKVIEIHEGKYRLTINVIDEFNSLPISGVRVAQTGGAVKISDNQGQCWFDLDQGSYSFEITKAGYRAAVEAWTISNSDKEVTAFLTRTTNTWDLTVTVKTQDENTVWGATVKVGGTEKLTAQDGVVTFNDVEEGEYAVTAQMGTLSGTESINLDRTQSITITITEGGGVVGGIDISIIYIAIGMAAVIIVLGALVYMKRNGMWIFGKRKKKR